MPHPGTAQRFKEPGVRKTQRPRQAQHMCCNRLHVHWQGDRTHGALACPGLPAQHNAAARNGNYPPGLRQAGAQRQTLPVRGRGLGAQQGGNVWRKFRMHSGVQTHAACVVTHVGNGHQ